MKHWKLNQSCKYEGRLIKFDVFGQGDPLVIVHGTPWSSYNMRHMIESLSKSYQVYFYDMVGFGQSDQSDGDVSPSKQAEILDQLLMYWKLEKPTIIAHDLGGAVTLNAHLKLKCQFKKIILINPIAVTPWASDFFKQARDHEAAFAGLPDGCHEALLRYYVKSAAGANLDDATLEASLVPWLQDGGKEAFYRQMAQSVDACTDDIEPLYSMIRDPVHIIWGLSNSVLPVEHGKQLHEMILSSEFICIPHVGHLVMEEQPDIILEKIEEVLGDSQAGSRAA